MCNGEIEQIGTPEEIYNHPKTPFVARFIGSINEFPGTLLAGTGQNAKVQTASGSMQVSATRRGSRPLPPLREGQSVSVLVRPENIKISSTTSTSESAGGNSLSGVLKEILYQGPMTQFLVESASYPGMTITVTSPTSSLHQHQLGIEVSEPVSLSFDGEDLLLMAAEAAAP
jgi:ABC-type Fe3+/spermidine/putrescine transport system ATPase subunit